MFLFLNPLTLTSGDFHPHNCGHMIFIVLLLSELRGTLGSSVCSPTSSKVGVFPCSHPCFFQQVRVRVFHPTLVIESKIFFGWILPCRETVPLPDKAHMSQERVDRRTSSQLHYLFIYFLNFSLMIP